MNNSSYNKSDGSQKKDPPTRHQPDEDEDRAASPSSPRSKTTKTRNTDKTAKQQARAAAARAASSGVHRKPPPPGPFASAVTATETVTRRGTTATATARAMSDAQAKLRGRKPSSSNSSKKGNAAPTIRAQPQRSMPSHLQSSTNGNSTNMSSTVTTKLQKLQEEVAAKASGRAPNTTAVSTQRRSPAILPLSMHSQSSSSVGSSLSAIKRLNRMEEDIAAKERARAGRRSGTARAKGIATTTTTATSFPPSKSAAAKPIAARRLDRMEADIAAKAKVGRASAALKKNGRRNGNGNGNNRVDALAKKLNKNRAARSTPATVPGAVSSNRNAGGMDSAVEGTKRKESTNEGMKGAAATTHSDGKKQHGTSSKHKSYHNGGSNMYGDLGVSTDTTLPSGSDDSFVDKSHKASNSNGLAVAIAVFEDENENVFIPSAVEYDPDAKPPVYKNQRFRVYGLLICTLLIIIAACTIGVLTILENNEIESDWIPTESPTCIRCTMDFIEQLELEVGSEKLQDPTSPEYMAKEWIIHEDEMQLMSTDRDFIQRFLLAVFYFDTHQIADWRSCNRQNLDPSFNENEECQFLKLTAIKPTLGFQGVTATRWLTSGKECLWAGVICDASGQVRSIDLHGQGIQGTLPAIISRIPYIQTIALQWNDLTGTLPAEFGRMKHLIHIELHRNEFTGSLPPSWSNIRNLQLLNLSQNSLTGQLPKEVGNFRNIKGLFLFKNQFSGTLPPQLADSNSLAFMRLHKNPFEGTIPSEFGEMQLTELWLHGTNITGSIPVEFGKLANSLTDLRLSETRLSGTLPEVLFDMSQMWRLDLTKSRLTGTISPDITRLRNIQTLRLGDNQFTGKVPDGLGAMTKLMELTLNGNNLTGSIPSDICDLKEEEFRLENLTADCLPGTDLTQGNSCECCDECCDASGNCQLQGTQEPELP